MRRWHILFPIEVRVAVIGMMLGIAILNPWWPLPAQAQQPGSGSQQPTPAGVIGSSNGHVVIAGGGVPSMTGGTIDDGSTDNQGSFIASAGSGSITFAAPYVRPPFCDITGYVGAAPASYTVTALGIALSTITSTDRYTWQCVAKPGG